jgi:hypothetical protein
MGKMTTHPASTSLAAHRFRRFRRARAKAAHRAGQYATLGAIALIGLGCERKAPGPKECLAFAEVTAPTLGNGPRSAEGIAADVERLTRQCLTTPYDRELLQCVERGWELGRCEYEFRLRRRGDHATRDIEGRPRGTRAF